ncbi:MAG: OmpA family protein [Pseudomonadota bacterium]
MVPYLKIGVAHTRNEVSDPRIVYDRENPLGVFFGAGVTWRFAPTWALDAEWASYDRDESFLSLGIKKRFGAAKPAAPTVAAAPVFEAPVTVIPLPAVVVERPVAMLPKDSDGDGVLDGQDRCPRTVAGAQVDARGCEIVLERDDDQDGIGNGRDHCPASKPGAKVDNLGCELPDLVALRGVHFEIGASRLTPDSKVVLDGMAETLRNYPEMLVEVAGHTDNRGSALYNLNLPQQQARVRAVADYLLSQGVAKTSLIAKGYGESVPVRENTSEAGRTTNRRVELHILRR